MTRQICVQQNKSCIVGFYIKSEIIYTPNVKNHYVGFGLFMIFLILCRLWLFKKLDDRREVKYRKIQHKQTQLMLVILKKYNKWQWANSL